MPSYLSYKNFLSVLDEDDNIESWITVNGNHIPILKGQSKKEAVEAFIDKKVNSQNDNIIRGGHKDFGKPGKYEVYRSGDLKAPAGTIFTAAYKHVAHAYGDDEIKQNVDTYHIDIKNPLVIEGSNAVDVLRKTYKHLFGKEIKEPLDSITWPNYDKKIANRLKNTKYDAIITKEAGRAMEIQVPASRRGELNLVKSQTRSGMNIRENEEYKKADKEGDDFFKEYVKYRDSLTTKATPEQQEHLERLDEQKLAAYKYRNTVSSLLLEDYYDDEDQQSLSNVMNSYLNDLKSGNTNIKTNYPIRQVEKGVKKIHLPQDEAVKCTEQIIEYTRNWEKGDRKLIDKAIWNSDPYNKKTYSGIEKRWNRDFKVGDEINGRLISWSKNFLVAMQFQSIDDTRKILVIDENPGMDISDFSSELDEEEVLTATDMNFVVKDIKQWEGFDIINLEYKGKKQ